jgi:dTDP-4-amino-4,6-dideoxygalactose transaminase
VKSQAQARVARSETVPVSAVPFHRPDIGEEEIAAAVEAMRSGWLTCGPKTLEFEQLFAEAIGASHAITVSSCTAALHLALDALDLERGDEVITSTLTLPATGATIVHAGARPVLADVTADTLIERGRSSAFTSRATRRRWTSSPSLRSGTVSP